MIAVAGLVLLISMVAGAGSLIGLLWPIPGVFKSRRHAGKALLGSFIVFVAGAVLAAIGSPSSGGANKADAKAVPSAPTKPTVSPKEQLTQESKALWIHLHETMEPCDAATKDVQDIPKHASDAYQAYSVVKDAQEACENVSGKISALKPPPSAQGDVRKAFEDALEECSTAYFARSAAFSKVATVLDGDDRPSAVVEARKGVDAASVLGMGCALKFVQAAVKGGVRYETFAADEPEPKPHGRRRKS